MRALKKKKISTVLLINHHLQYLAGSELVTFDLAKFYSDAGVEVTIATFVYGGVMQELFSGTDINVVDLSENHGELLSKQYDLIWAHHWPVLGYCLYEMGVQFRYLVVSSLSPLEPLEQLVIAREDADVLLFHSSSNFDSQSYSLTDAIKSKTRVFLNSLGEEWFDSRGLQEIPGERDLVVVSNHVPEELMEAIDLLKKAGIEVTIYGQGNRVERITPEHIDECSAVVTIGHTVQKALARGVPVYCYDRFGGPGWITKKNIDLAEQYNFSGRCTGQHRSAAELADELVNGLTKPDVLENQDIKGLAANRYDLASNVNATLAMLPDNVPSLRRANPNPQHRMLCQLYARHAVGIDIPALVNQGDNPICRLHRDEARKDNWLQYFEIFSVDRLPRVIYKNSGPIVIGGVALLKAELDCQLNEILAVASDGVVIARAVLGIYSPGMGKKYPASPYSYSSRYSMVISSSEIPDKFDLVAVLHGGTRVLLHTLEY